jgi:hypothetical protein
MSETAVDVIERKNRDNTRLKNIAIRHGAIGLAAITIWGSSDLWALESGLVLAMVVSVLNGLFFGILLAYGFHEWGHFTGARISGAVSPVLKEPRSFFMFSFKQEVNSRAQFLSMSAGGPAANWFLVLLVYALLPLTTASQAMILSATVGVAVSVSVFEIPIINRVMYGDNPEETIQTRLKEIGSTSKIAGIAAGTLIFMMAFG